MLWRLTAKSWAAGLRIKDGRFPKAVKLGPRMTAWRVEYIRALLESPLGKTKTGA